MAPGLRQPDFSQEFVIKCDDVSGQGLVDILTQNGRPVALHQDIRRKKFGENNLLSKQFLLQKITTVDQQNWAAKLLWYKPGLENRGADTRSNIYQDANYG